jgi:hypothetical protein
VNGKNDDLTFLDFREESFFDEEGSSRRSYVFPGHLARRNLVRSGQTKSFVDLACS